MMVELKSELTIEQTCMVMAEMLAKARSKDPQTKVGCIVYDPVTGGMFPGYNGFPQGFPDLALIWNNRDDSINKFQYGRVLCKHAFVVHAEANAIRKAMMALGSEVRRCTVITTNLPCEMCMRDWIAPCGIKRVVFKVKYPYHPAAIELANKLNIEIVQFNDQASYS